MGQNRVLGPIIADDAPRVKQLIAKLRIDVQDIIFCRLFLERSSDPTIVDFLNAASAGKKTILLIRGAILQRLVMALMRMHDKERRERDCLPEAFHLLIKENQRMKMTRHGGESLVDRAYRLWTSIDHGTLQSLRHSRNFEIAHTITTKMSFDQPKWSDLIKLSKDTEEIIEFLSDGVGVCTVPLESYEDCLADDIKQYWRYLGLQDECSTTRNSH